MTDVILKTTMRDFDDLHERHDKTRGSMVKVPRQTLINLLVDHGIMVGKLEDVGHKVTDGVGDGVIPVRVRRRTKS